MQESDPNTNSEHWAQTEERGSIKGILFLLYAFKYMGAMVCRICMTPVLLYFYLTNRQARMALLQFLQRLIVHAESQNQSIQAKANQWHVWRVFLNFGYGFVDRLSAWQGDTKRFVLNKSNDRLFLDLKNRGQGAILLVSHVGNFEMARMAALSHKDLNEDPVIFNVFMHTKNAQKITAAIRKFNPDYAVNFIQGDELNMGLAIQLQERIEAGEFIVIAGDRIPVDNHEAVTEVEFLGHTAALPIGPYVLAKVLKCPLLTMNCMKIKGGYEVSFELLRERIQFNKSNREATIAEVALDYAQSLQALMLKHPLQWYNFHPFWKQNKLKDGTNPTHS